MSKILIALGGNALGNTPEEQLQMVKKASKPITDLIEQGHEVVITHGNGPQVGMINLALEVASKLNPAIPSMPLPECGAMSQGYIGYHLQNAMRAELKSRNIEKSVATIISQTIVDPQDPAFENPTKPIGSFYTKEQAETLMKETGDTYIEDSGRGYRLVIASPQPLKVVETDTIRKLVDAGQIVISAGGGGIPVVEKGHELQGVQAVIDKDAASVRLAEELDMEYLFMLTAVEQVAIRFGKPNQKNLRHVSVDEARQWIDEGQFPPGSMLPKVEAAIRFVDSKPGRKAVISSLEKAKEALLGKTGTTFYNNQISQSPKTLTDQNQH